jgi:AAA family ATP:ADP antiporter
VVKAIKVEAELDRRGGFALVMKDRYLRLLAIMLLVATIINTTGEYVVGKMATERSEVAAAEILAMPSPVERTADQRELVAHDAQAEFIGTFYSNYYTIVNLLSALLQALIVARLLTTLGVRRSLFIMPLVVLTGWFGLFLFSNLTIVRVEKSAENSLDYSLHNTLRAALFLPTSRAAKYKAKAAIDTFFFRMGDVIAGLGIVFLLVTVLGLGTRAFAVLNICLAACWLVLAYRTGRAYDLLTAEPAKEADPVRLAA